MTPYVFIFETGNGYRCNCCLRTFQTHDILEFACDADAKAKAQEINSKFSTDDEATDCRVTSVYALASPTSLI